MAAKPNTENVMNKAEEIVSQGAVLACCRTPSESILPHAGSGGGDATPKKLRAATTTIAHPIWFVTSTIREARVFGAMCRKMILESEAPSDRAAST